MAFIDEADDVSLGLIILGKIGHQFFHIFINIRILARIMPILVDKRANDRIFIGIQNLPQISAALGTLNLLLAYIKEQTLNLVIQLIPVSDDDHTAVCNVLPDPLGEPDHDERLTGALRVPDDPSLTILNALLGGLHGKELVVPCCFLDPGIKDDKVMFGSCFHIRSAY